MRRPKIAVICRTIGLEYDDRIRKECISISKNAEVKIFVTFESNVEEDGITSYGIPYKSFKLRTREKLRSGKFLLAKALEFYLKVKPELKEFDLIWAHEEYTFLFPLLARKNSVIWDLHELPERFDRPVLRKMFHLIENKSKYIIHANSFRIDYAITRGLIRCPSKHTYIRNYPDQKFVESELIPDFYNDFILWLDGINYVYLQGISTPDRFPYNSIVSILRFTTLKVVIVGIFNNKELIKRLTSEFGTEFAKRVYLTGLVNQLSTPVLVKNAKFCMIFYQTNTPNQRYCEANRFYQSLVLGVPVITGNNEPLEQIVSNLNCGISIPSDGRILEDVIEAVNILMLNYPVYKENAIKNKNNFVWNDVWMFNLIG